MNKFCNTLYILFLYLENISNGLLQTRQAIFPSFFFTQFSEHATTITKAIIRQIIAEKNWKRNNMLMHHSLHKLQVKASHIKNERKH